MKNKFIVIYNDLVKALRQGEFKAGDTLPSENELTIRFETSRETIRKALNLLSQNGYIQKVRGKGSVILDHSKFEFPVSGLTSFHELSNQLGQTVKTHVHELFLETANNQLRSRLNCSEDMRIWKISRSREIDGERIILDKDYILEDVVPGLTKSVAEHSIYDYIENQLELEISFAKKEIVVEPVTEEDKAHLDLDNHSQVAVIRSYVYLADATLFQYTESRHRPDKFQFVDFARRTK
ncbi:trehalose operon repressor [Halobacillus amylolyticus]|uniref:Trehalose operon repressor n=1 Tax=Halobacillus amylolyticus TaxID=2932259 RepID=A0ABY4HCC3_9BACI|nr:trehalose operon repressor [Halobacillus amylolyticus]UOR11060.1 trehalose operon repressor [Halobacillus amylolyticus]